MSKVIPGRCIGAEWEGPPTQPFGLCKCGCGLPTRIATKTDRREGHVKGQPIQFIQGHVQRGKRYEKGSRPSISAWMSNRTVSAETKTKLSIARKGPRGSAWKGGKSRINGYIYFWYPDHPYANKRGYVMEHRLVMEFVLGRYLKPEEVVHHINKVTDDNRPENLQLFASQREHTAYHHPKSMAAEPPPVVVGGAPLIAECLRRTLEGELSESGSLRG